MSECPFCDRTDKHGHTYVDLEHEISRKDVVDWILADRGRLVDVLAELLRRAPPLAWWIRGTLVRISRRTAYDTSIIGRVTGFPPNGWAADAQRFGKTGTLGVFSSVDAAKAKVEAAHPGVLVLQREWEEGDDG